MTHYGYDAAGEGDAGLTRRRLLRIGAGTGLTIAAGGLLAACGSDGSGGGTATVSGAVTGGGRPIRGGTLKVGLITAGSSESCVPWNAITFPDWMRIQSLYDSLYYVGPDLQLERGLAVGEDSNKDASVWQIHLREGVTWHDGRPLTADDVVWTMSRWADERTLAYGYVGAFIDFKGVRKRGPRTVEIPLNFKVAEFPGVLSTATNTLGIIKDGQTEKDLNTNPIGTGPFTFKSFQPGRTSTFAANADYWRHDGPYVDELIIDTSFSDENARVNALQSGVMDVLPALPFATGRQYANSDAFRVLASPDNTPNDQYFYLRCDTGPFADKRVRQAMRLIADRRALITGALGGFGTPGADVLGVGLEYYDDQWERAQDIEQAKSLLRSAGASDLRVTLEASIAIPSGVEAATLLKQQAKAAGVDITVKTVDPAAYFVADGGFGVRSFGEDFTISYCALPPLYGANVWSKGVPNKLEAYFGDARTDRVLFEAMAATDPAKAAELWSETQRLQYEEGGMLLWAHAPYISAVGNDIHGVEETRAQFMNGWDVSGAWHAKA